MHILPPLETVKDIAATQQYDVLPLSCEILSDFITPIEAMRILKNVSTHCYMLESAQADDRWGRYTFLGFDPKLEITCIDGKMKAAGQQNVGHIQKDQPTLIGEGEITQYLGDAVALVCARDQETLEKAKKLVRVVYEELPAVYGPEEASAPAVLNK